MSIQYDPQTYRVTEKPVWLKAILGIAIAALGASTLGWKANPSQFFHSYLTACMVFLGVALGGLFFTLLHHLVGAKWSVVLRRLGEALASTLPWLALLFLPILIWGLPHLYPWIGEASTSDPLLIKKAPFLNLPFFVGRAGLYWLVWIGLSLLLWKRSLAQDQGHSSWTHLKGISALGMILFGFSVTFASFDWIMSLDPHWYSTIFGVYFFSGAVMSAVAFLIVALFFLHRIGTLKDAITVEHYHDLGKLLLTFVSFWAYIAFSQYLLIWYADIPEETVWYGHRLHGSWFFWGLLLAVGHFALPFVLLLTRGIKRSPLGIALVAVWMLVLHWVDLYWLILPNLHHHGVHLTWVDLTTLIGVGSFLVWAFFDRLFSHPMVPVQDPQLQTSMEFINP